jgi:propionyl-CoA synthetase
VVIVSADAGSRGGKAVPYKPLLDEAMRWPSTNQRRCCWWIGAWPPCRCRPGATTSGALARAAQWTPKVPCEWLESKHPSYTLYTSGTTGKPKGVQRDTGGYTVALASSMQHIFAARPGKLFSPPATLAGWWATATSSMAR